MLARLDLGRLASVPGALVVDAPGLTELAACSLTTAGSVTLSHTALTSLDGLAALSTCESLSVTDNVALPACFVDALAARPGIASTVASGNTGQTAPDCAVPPTCGG